MSAPVAERDRPTDLPPDPARRHADVTAGGPVDPGGPVPPRPATAAGSFVGSFVEDDGPVGDDTVGDGGSVTLLLRGHCDAETTERVRAHLEAALERGARFVTVEIIGRLESARGVCDLFACTQTRLAGRRGLLVIRGLHPHMLDAQAHAHADTDVDADTSAGAAPS